MAKSFWQRGEDYAKKVSGEIIDQIKAGVAPWQKPWKPGEQISAENFSTGNKYSGGNSLYLMSRAIRDGRGDNRWGTYNQIREAGGQVRKGEKGTQVLFFTDRNSRVAKDEKGQTMKNKRATLDAVDLAEVQGCRRAHNQLGFAYQVGFVRLLNRCLTLIVACIIYWQAKDISRVIRTADPERHGIELSLLRHVSPIEWDNIVLYGEYVLNRRLVRRSRSWP